VTVNVGHPSGSNALELALTATMEAVFPHVARDAIDRTNTLLIGAREPLEGTRVQAAPVPQALRPLAWTQGEKLGPPLRGGTVFTDDRAPVEWLIDTSIVKYAAEESR
jgi:hypothetical protein